MNTQSKAGTKRSRAGLALAGAALLALAPQSGQAQVTAAQAAEVERDLQGWFAGLLAPLVKPEQVPVKISPAGERYRVEMGTLPLPGLNIKTLGTTGGFLRAGPGGTWIVEEIRLPDRFEMRMGDDSAQAAVVRIGEQSGQMLIDPTLATPTRFEASYGNYEQSIKSLTDSSARMARVSMRGELVPGANQRMTLASETRISGYEQRDVTPDGEVMGVRAREILATSRGEGLSLMRLGETIRTAAALAGDMQANGDREPGQSPAQQKMLKTLLHAVADLFGQFDSEQSWNGIAVTYGQMTTTLERFGLGTRLGAPEGRSAVGVRLELAGLNSPMLPDGPMRALVPRRIALDSRVEGVRKSDLVALLSRGIDTIGDDDAEFSAELKQLFADSPTLVALDGLDIDLGTSRLRGSGQVRMNAAMDFNGKAELRMTGMEALMKTTSAIPEAAMATPVLLILKGLGEQVGGELVWRITYADGQAMVNGQPLSALMPK